MATRTFSGQIGTSVEYPRFGVAGICKSLLQPCGAFNRQLLASGDVGYRGRFSPVSSDIGDSRLRDEQMGDEGEDE